MRLKFCYIYNSLQLIYFGLSYLSFLFTAKSTSPKIESGDSVQASSNKGISGKAKRDIINNKAIGNELDAFEDKDSGCISITDTTKLPSNDSSSTNVQPEGISFSDKSEKTQNIDSQIMDTEKETNFAPSTEIESDIETRFNHVNKNVNADQNSPFTTKHDNKQEVKLSIEDSDRKFDNIPKDVNQKETSIEKTQENNIDGSIDEMDQPVVENGILEKGPTLKYEYKPGNYNSIIFNYLIHIIYSTLN